MHEEYTLVGQDGNAYNIMGYVAHTMKENKYTKQEIDDYIIEAKSSDYDNLVRVSMAMLDIINESNRCE